MTVLLTSEPLVELLESPRIIDARYGVFFRLHPASIPSIPANWSANAVKANVVRARIGKNTPNQKMRIFRDGGSARSELKRSNTAKSFSYSL